MIRFTIFIEMLKVFFRIDREDNKLFFPFSFLRHYPNFNYFLLFQMKLNNLYYFTVCFRYYVIDYFYLYPKNRIF